MDNTDKRLALMLLGLETLRQLALITQDMKHFTEKDGDVAYAHFVVRRALRALAIRTTELGLTRKDVEKHEQH